MRCADATSVVLRSRAVLLIVSYPFSFLPRDRRSMLVRCVSFLGVSPSVRHTPVLSRHCSHHGMISEQ